MEHKIALLGLYSAGKRAIVIRCVSNYFLEDDSHLPSVEDSYRKQIVCDDIVCALSLQYAIGQEEYYAFHEQLCGNRKQNSQKEN
jgi:GTPase KRas protein